MPVEPAYADLYNKVWMYSDRAQEQGIDARDTGVDLVARTINGAFHAIQCKLYAENYTLQKGDIDSFFTASGKKPFVYRIIVSTTNNWSVQSGFTIGTTAPSHAMQKVLDALHEHHLEKEADTREDVFYYIYGLLHSPDYRERYGDNLSKELPRIPCVEKAIDFWAFSTAGRELAELHIDYEKVKPCSFIKVDIATSAPENSEKRYRVEKMRYGKTKENGKTVDDKTTPSLHRKDKQYCASL